MKGRIYTLLSFLLLTLSCKHGVFKWNGKIDNATKLDADIADIDNQLEFLRSRFKGATATVTAERDTTVIVKDYLQ